MAVDNNPSSPFYGRMYLSWNDFDDDGALYVTRSDNGTTWTRVEVFNVVASTFIRDVQIQVAPNGNVILVGMDEGDPGGASSRRNYAFRSTDGGVTFSVAGIPMGARFTPPCDFTAGYFRVCKPIWRHMG